MELAVEEVVIVGGGIAGLATAVALKRVGIGALVLERSEGLRAFGSALTLFPNAWLALDVLGVSQKLTSQYAPSIKGYITNVETGDIQEINYTSADGKNKVGPRSVHRKALLEALADEILKDRIRFSSKLISIGTQTHQGSSIAVIRMADDTTIRAKVLIGCDGVHSIVSRWLGLADAVSSGRASVRGLTLYPQGHGLNHEVQQFVGVGKRGGFIPLNDQELYCFLTYKSPPTGEETMANDPILIQRELIENYAKDFSSSYLEIARHYDLSTLTWAPLLFRRPWDVVFGKLSKGTITVAGDAMHPMTPDLGQGGCAALEDAVVLGRHIGESYNKNGKQLIPGEMTRAIENYVRERRWRAAGLIAASYLSGWAQQGGSGWWKKFFRDVIFYKLLYSRIASVSNFDCGKLTNHEELNNSRKMD